MYLFRQWVLYLVLCLITVLNATAISSSAAAIHFLPAQEEALAAGQSREVSLQPGGEYSVALRADSAAAVLVWVEQDGCDLKLRLHLADEQPALFDASNHFRGRELIVLAARESRSARLDVLLEPTQPPCRFTLQAESLADVPADRIKGEQALMKAARLDQDDGRPQALPALEEAVQAFEEAGDDKRLADALYQRGSAKNNLGQRKESLQDYARALSLGEALGDLSLQGMAHNSLGLINFGLGQQDAARHHLARAEEIFTQSNDGVGLSAAIANWCLTVQSQGDLLKARACYERALQLGRENRLAWLQGIEHTNLARVADLLGDPEQAQHHYQQALEIYEQGDRPLNVAHTLQNQAVLLRRMGEVQEALLLYEQALEIFRGRKELVWLARTLTSLGRAYMELGEVDRARDYFEQALPLRRQVGDRRGEGHTLVNLAGAQQAQGEMEDSLPNLQQALDLYRELKYPLGTVSALRLTGDAQMELGNLEEAERSFRESLQAAQDLKRPLQEAAARSHLARLQARRGGVEEARQNLRTALQLCGSVRPCRADIHLGAAKIELEAGRPGHAESSADEAISIIESLRERISSPERRASYLATQREAYQIKIGLLMGRHQEDPSAGYDRRALELSERGRTRALVEYLREAQSQLAQGVSDQVLRRREELRRDLNYKAAAQLRAESRGDEEAAAGLESELSLILAEIDNLEARIRRRAPRYAELTRPTSLQAREIQALLDEDTLLLEYSLSAQGPSHAWSVSRSQILSFGLAPGSQIEEAAHQVFQRLRRFDPGGQEQQDEAVRRLSRLLLEPLADVVQPGQRLVIVSDGALHYIPFAALFSPRAPHNRLLDEHEIVHLPSASALAVQRDVLSPAGSSPAPVSEPAADACRAAILADPVLQAWDERLRVMPSSEAERPQEGGFQRLHASRGEAEAIASLVPQERVRLLTGFDAGLKALQSPSLRDCRVLHFATHGWIDDQRPELSGLVLSQFTPQGNPQDGFLRMLDVYALQLSTELVVLSGCQTADGKMVGGEGLVGLTRAFMYAGVPRVVASLWQVQDRATAQLMRHFYQGLWVENLAPAAALQQAQMKIRQDRRWRNPYFWSAFLLQGEWR
ncbi:MAG TPA: CHAT domain-containing protein [Acidobacteriota bacterium]|nr:CHAT domain-containing protein [Acidobacteriota bacterium]